MIERVTDINFLSGVSSPLLPLIYVCFRFSESNSDGVFAQLDGDGNTVAVLSVNNSGAVLVKIGNDVDTDEIFSFFKFSGVSSYVSDVSLNNRNEKTRKLLSGVSCFEKCCDVNVITPESVADEYRGVFELLSDNSEFFENWYSLFSKKINNGFAEAVYNRENGTPVSTAVATAVYGGSAVVSGVFTSVLFRNRGKASLCIKKLMSELYSVNVKKVYLWCDDGKVPFYEKLNFTVCGEVYCGEDV